MNFKGAYLRVLTPKTTNGIVPLTINGEVQYRETFLPLTAKKQLEKKNARLKKGGFTHLVADVEVVGEIKKPNPQPSQKIADPIQDVASESEPEVKPKKPNPKPKRLSK